MKILVLLFIGVILYSISMCLYVDWNLFTSGVHRLEIREGIYIGIITILFLLYSVICVLINGEIINKKLECENIDLFIENEHFLREFYK